MRAVPKKLGAEYYRNLLNRQGRRFYDCINRQLLEKGYSGVTELAIEDEKTAVSDCFAAYKAVRDDHPEYFFLGFQSEFLYQKRFGTLRYPILYSAAQIREIQYQLRKYICSLVRGTAELTVLEKERLVYERIARRLTYRNNQDVRDHNIVGPVLFSAGVCEGQNALLLLCLRRIGIPCIKVYGKTRTDTVHCWTIAWVKGEPVHCDVTWDGTKKGDVSFRYLNLSDRQISADHKAFLCSQIPKCRSEACVPLYTEGKEG